MPPSSWEKRVNKEHSFGIIPCRWNQGQLEIFLVQLHAGHWGFPKGHPISGEEPFETAQRELYEETGLSVKTLLRPEPLNESYQFIRNGTETQKTVTYYLAEVQGKIMPQSEELQNCDWFKEEQLIEKLTFSEAKSVARTAISILNHIKNT